MAATLWATLAAPPKAACDPVTRSTGIGASGEMRLTSPATYRSKHHVAQDEHGAASKTRDKVGDPSIGGLLTAKYACIYAVCRHPIPHP
jgi:hypothetical protein